MTHLADRDARGNEGIFPAFVALLLCCLMVGVRPSPALAQNPTQTQMINRLQEQIQQLQEQLNELRSGLNTQAEETKRAQEETRRTQEETRRTQEETKRVQAETQRVQERQEVVRGPAGQFSFGPGIKLTLGGFFDVDGIYRSRNETADSASVWNAIPFPNSPNNHLSEFRGSAHQTRISLLGEGKVDQDTALAAYLETDFQASAATANSVESNSYTPRLRQAYSTYDRSDLGVHVLGGQAWSLLTLGRQRITPRQEEIPMTIDSQYVPGFTWTRNAQLRVVKDFGKTVSLGVSLESPQASIFSAPNAPLVPTTLTNPGADFLNPLVNYSVDPWPDIVAKLALDPGWGHYELYGIARWFRSRSGGQNNTIGGGGVGGGMVLPLIPGKLELEASVLAGYGIGRYGSALFPDVAVKPSGVLAPIPEVQALLGLVGHPTDALDLYLYGGTEQVGRTAFTVNGRPFGYGNARYDNSGCLIEGSTACAQNTSGVWQATIGAWYRLYKGDFGQFQVGLQESYTRRNIFSGIGGAPSTDENVVMASMRYYPF